jgi:hypothetical protein
MDRPAVGVRVSGGEEGGGLSPLFTKPRGYTHRN